MEGLFYRGIEFAKSEPIIAIIIVGVIVALFFFKRKALISLGLAVLVIAFLIYVFSLIFGMTSAGFFQKEGLVEKSHLQEP